MINETTPVYQDSARSVEARVNNLLDQMTLDEKLAQLGSVWVYQLFPFEERAAGLLQDGIGQITRIGGASNLPPREAAETANRIQKYLMEETRLGIPAMVHEECCSGYMARGATSFPQAIGLAATWEPELAARMADVIRIQVRAAGGHQGLAPVLDISQDPRWGRVEETFGEDPYLIASMGAAYVGALQGDDWNERVIATLKHLAGHGVPEGGRNWNPVHIPMRELREVFLKPFEAVIKTAGALSVMNAYHEIDGIPCAASEELLTNILRGEWGFDGLVVSDYFAVEQIQVSHHVAGSKTEAAVQGLIAGIDSELPSTNCYGDPLREALDQGLIGMDVIDRSVKRTLEMKLNLGLFENPYVDVDHAVAVLDTPAQRALAHEIAVKSIVLLKNEGDLLPLRKDVGSIAVIGPNANSSRNLLGDYSFPAHVESLLESSKNNILNMAVPDPSLLQNGDLGVTIRPILEVLRECISPSTVVHYAEGCDVNSESRAGFDAAVDAAGRAEVALLFLGDKSGLTDSCTSGETRDRADIGLPGVQQELLEAVAATGTPVIVVLNTGRPLAITWMADNVPAILEMWLPGEEGAEAIADVLFGDANPSGKLPMTFPRQVGQIPTYYYQKSSGGRSHWKGPYVDLSNEPLYPFGYGLSYACFDVSNLRLDHSEIQPGESITLQVDVATTGTRDGAEVIQVYIRDEVASVTRPLKELIGFKRVELTPGQKKTVTFTIQANQLGLYNRSMKYVVEPGTFQLMVGTSSVDLPLTAQIQVIGSETEIADKVFFSTAALS
jgi:beta-glucosidase